MIAMSVSEKTEAGFKIQKEYLTKGLMFVVALLLSAITFISGLIVVKLDNVEKKVETVSQNLEAKIDAVAKDVQEIKVTNSRYYEKVDAIEKKGEKK